MSVTVELLADLAGLDQLVVDAETDGCRMVSRLIQDWTDGTNQFNLPGERAYCAVDMGRIEGICGLNQDPFAGDPTISRVRRLYVATACRRQGIGSALMHRLIDDARIHFQKLHLRTHDPVASAFYESLGFSRVGDDPNCTHRLTVA